MTHTVYQAWAQGHRIVVLWGTLYRISTPHGSGGPYLITLGGWRRREGRCLRVRWETPVQPVTRPAQLEFWKDVERMAREAAK